SKILIHRFRHLISDAWSTCTCSLFLPIGGPCREAFVPSEAMISQPSRGHGRGDRRVILHDNDVTSFVTGFELVDPPLALDGLDMTRLHRVLDPALGRSQTPQHPERPSDVLCLQLLSLTAPERLLDRRQLRPRGRSCGAVVEPDDVLGEVP